ncbi:MAG: protein translocase subunit SecD [Deltaproteobacteria bacterium]|nr:protein translocase subunit SecD [Deltaproteobacteria bacterium]
MKPVRWRLTFIIALTLLAIYGVAPTLIYFAQPTELRNDPEHFRKVVPSWLPQSHARLGLDIQGGSHLTLGVQTSSAIENRLNRVGVEALRSAREQGIEISSAYVAKDQNRLMVVSEKESDLERIRSLFRKEYPHLTMVRRDGLQLSYVYKEEEMTRITSSALEQAENVIRNRIDRWGVSEPMVNRRADGSIQVQLPGFSDPEQAKELLGRTAQLRFQLVDDQFEPFSKIRDDQLPQGISAANNGSQLAFTGESREQLEQFLKDFVPEGHQLLFSREAIGDGSANRFKWTSYVLFSNVLLTGDDIQDARVAIQSDGMGKSPVVSLKLTGPGGRQFAQVTGSNINKRLAIVLDDVVESAPVIQQKIATGDAQISIGKGGGRSFNESVNEAQQLALVLKSGAIPATITVLEERQVGASLGPELANQGIRGILVGLLLVLAFMVLYYRRPGGIACLVLLLNGLFLLAVMAGFGFALTLPGIAGFVLTLGMAVDANVLINERIRQEIREGRHPRKAVSSGFDKVFWTIVDANVTTLIAAAVLLETNSSGPIRGFAVTLMIGLIVSLFTSLYCSRLLFDLALSRVPDSRLKTWLGADSSPLKLGPASWNFLKAGKPVTIFAALLSAVVLATSFTKGLNFGVDFSGGTEVLVRFSADVEASEIENVGDKAHVDGLTIQALEGGKRQYLIRYDENREEAEQVKASASEVFLAFKEGLMTDLKDKSPEIQQVEFVGPQVGKELRLQGILSIIYAILAVIIYIAFRFDMRFSPGAFVKMFLDIFIMLGFYAFFQVSFDLVSVAAFLTVVGYSVNDTIVIYDRIRENMLNHPGRKLMENINMAINETLSRSVNTSLTTIISLGGILVFASGQIWSFAMSMTIGVVVATLTSILIAPSFVLWLQGWQQRTGKIKTPSASGGRQARA